MNIQWIGHSCFLITMENGKRILTDPYNAAVGYPMHHIAADYVTISHGHFDHNYVGMVVGDPVVINTPQSHAYPWVTITGIPSSHDNEGGKQRGENIIFLFESEELRIAHLGDLGHIPNQETLDRLGNLDVMLAPVGGTYTIGPREACDIANATNANVFIPMHYQTPVLTLDKTLLGVDRLMSIAKDCSIHRLNQNECTITKASLGDDRLLVLDYTHEPIEQEL